MAAPREHAEETEEQEEEVFLTEDDILAEVGDDGDQPMEDDDEEAGDIVGDLPEAGPSNVGDDDDEVLEDNSMGHFPNHTSSVFAVATHPSAPIVASGGEDDLGYIWDLHTGDVIVKLTGHTDSVTNVGFSSDGEMIATGGMDGKVRVWRRRGEDYKTWEFLTELQGPDEVTFLKWHPKGSVLLAGSNDTTVWLWQLPSGKTMQVFAGHTGAVSCGTFTPDGKRIVTACAEGTLIYWDPRSPTPVFKLSATDARFDLDGITSLAVNASSTLAVVGGAAGGVRVVSLSKGEVVSALGGHNEGESVEAVVFVDLAGTASGPGVAITGGTDGKALIWDLTTSRLRATLEHKDAVTTLLAHPTNTHIVVSGSADKRLRTWDARTGALLQEHTGHRGPILGAALGEEGKVIVSAGDDGVCLIYPTE